MKKLILISILLFISCQALSQEVPDSLKIVQDGWDYYQNDYKIHDRDILEITAANPLALKFMERARVYKTLNWIISFAGGGFIGYPVGTWLANKKTNWNLAYAGIGVLALSIPLEILYYHAKNKSMRIFNQGLPATVNCKLDFKIGITGDGFGIAMRF